MIVNIVGGFASCFILIAFLALLATTPTDPRPLPQRIRRDR